MSAVMEFWFGDDHFVVDADKAWDALGERWPEGVEKPDLKRAERTIRDIADPVKEDGG